MHNKTIKQILGNLFVMFGTIPEYVQEDDKEYYGVIPPEDEEEHVTRIKKTQFEVDEFVVLRIF